jgi:hypothetical protein
MGAKAMRSPLFHIWGRFLMWRCPACQMDCWSHWEKRTPSEKRFEKVERILANPLCVGCEQVFETKLKETKENVHAGN